MTVLGVLSDTHVPGRMVKLPSALLQTFRDHNVTAILHAGDICRPRVLTELRSIAPVTAVRGNHDLLWPLNWRLPPKVIQEFSGVKVGLIHGAETLGMYFLKKLARKKTIRSLATICAQFTADTRVIVYGHTHVPSIEWIGSTLLFNPGTVIPDWHTKDGPTAGLLEIEGGEVRPQIVRLKRDRDPLRP